MSVFSISIGEDDWDSGLGGWRCPVVSLPGAVVQQVIVNGAVQDDSWYQQRADLGILKWVRGEPPSRAYVLIALTEKLVSVRSRSFWKMLAIVLPVIGTVLSAFITKSCSGERCLSWQHVSKGTVPRDVFDAGAFEYADTIQGWPLFVCRVETMNAVVPGKLIGDYGCSFAVGARENASKDCEVLVGSDPRIHWVRTAGVMPATAVVAGHDALGPLYICRAEFKTGKHIGNTGSGTDHKCRISFGGAGIVIDSYDVLTFKST